MTAPSHLQADAWVALLGNPNCGKTTLFNALTGLRQKVANYPGITVDRKVGKCVTPTGTVNLVDLPGTYSLISRSPDERVAVDVLMGRLSGTPRPDVAVVVVDASNLPRNLFLLSQVIELRIPIVVAMTMTDLATKQGRAVDAKRLSTELGGVPVVNLIASKDVGIDQLRAAIADAKIATLPDWPLPPTFVDAIDQLEPELLELSNQTTLSPRTLAEHALVGESPVHIPPAIQSQVDVQRRRIQAIGIDPMQADIEAHYDWIDGVVARTVEGMAADSPVAQPQLDAAFASDAPKPRVSLPQLPSRPGDRLTQRLDAMFLHRLLGPVAFAVVMGLLFVSIFLLADHLIGAIEWAVDWAKVVVTSGMAEGPLKALLSDGLFGGVGSVVVFVPQIAILFLFLAVLEDSGYLARGAFLMDKLFARVGLSGKSFVPLLSSFACAIPGIMAARAIEDRQTRLATIAVAPFMSCSARLPVYGLLIGTFFASYSAFGQGMIMLACYVLGIVAAFASAWVFRKTFLKGNASHSFMLELPAYRLPSIRNVIRTVWTNTREFLVKAGTIIFALSIVMWALTYFPQMPEAQADAIKSQLDEESAERAIARAQLSYSLAGRFGHAIEPAIAPLGYDWKMGVGLVGAFAAREVFVGTLGTIYAAADPEEDDAGLRQAMLDDRYENGAAVWTTPVAISLLVWFVLAMQCISTVAILKRQTNTWRWPILLTVYMNALAYVSAFIAYRVALLFV
jgi:ferrous iron transport protein B